MQLIRCLNKFSLSLKFVYFADMTRIILIGFMGAGKTSLGKELSAKLGIPFIDSDSVIEKMEKKTIDEIFNQNGEDFFRSLEAEFVESVGELTDFVLAVGGGLPCHHDLILDLNRLGTTVYLKYSTETLFTRLSKDKDLRPLVNKLEETELQEYIQNLLKERDPIYSRAKFILDEGKQTCENIIALLPPQKN